MNSNKLTYLADPFLPDSIVVAFKTFNTSKSGHAIDSEEEESGSRLLNSMITEKLKCRSQEITTLKYEKPSATVDGRPLSVSFSHTKEAICAVFSDAWVVGIDMESCKRGVSEGLSSRMKHPKELLKFYKDYPIIQIWTMKEAALKAIGTGLRKPMNSVNLKAVHNNLFEVEFFNGIRANICSFQVHDKWISVCYISPELSESFLAKPYVPIHSARD